MNIRILVILSILIFSLSCSKGKRKEEFIAGKKFKYWLVVDNKTKNKSKTLYYFDRTGKWLLFMKYFNGEFAKYDGGDIIFIEKWRLINDSVIDIGTKSYKILKLNEKEFINGNDGDTQTLVIAPDTLIPLEYKKLQY